jgi:2-iminobutanoate/2-iminopropanoate deaminase
MTGMQHIPSEFSPSFSEAIRIEQGETAWILISGQIGVPLKPGGRPDDLSFEDEVRICFSRIAKSLEKCGCGLSDLVRMDVHITDLSLYSVFSGIRSELFPTNPPTSTAVQVAGLLLGARIEIGGMAHIRIKA